MQETLKLLREGLRPLYGKGETEAIIRIIFHHLKGWSVTDMAIHYADELTPFLKAEIEGILLRLLNHEPIQYITGEARFHGMDFKVTPDVLIPRPETDELVDIITGYWGDREDLDVLDIGTGSGCIAISLAKVLRFPDVTAIDNSSAALKVAEENARTLKTRVRFIEADVFTWCPASDFDIIVSNPPYVDESEKSGMERNVLDHEPGSALFVPDSNPLVYYKRIAEIAEKHLKPGGALYFEINPRHCDEMENLLHARGFNDVTVSLDSSGKRRFVTATHDEE